MIKMKSRLYFILFFIFFLSSIYCQSAFKYIKLNTCVEKAIEDYNNKYEYNGMLILRYLNKQKTDSFSLVGEIGIICFIISPPKYYSLVNDRVILIYNGEELTFNPSSSDMEIMFDFLSNFTDTKDIVRCDWTNKIIYHKQLLSKGDKPVINDPLIIDYHINNGTIVKSKIHSGEGGYPDLRFYYNFVEVPYIEKSK